MAEQLGHEIHFMNKSQDNGLIGVKTANFTSVWVKRLADGLALHD
jgi:hypothetical protein